PGPHPGTELLDRLGDGGQVEALPGRRREELLPGVQARPTLVELAPLALELGELDDPAQGGVEQALLLALDLRDGAAGGRLAGADLLRQPLPSLGPLQRLRDLLRLAQQAGQVVPDQGVELRDRDLTGATALAQLRGVVAVADVVAVAIPGRAGGRAEATAAATDHGPQQVVVLGVVARGALLIDRQFLLHPSEFLLADDRGHRERDPFLLRPRDLRAPGPDRAQRRAPAARGPVAGPIAVDPADGGRIAQDAADGAALPAGLAGRARDALPGQPRRDRRERRPLLEIPGEDLPDDLGAVGIEPQAGRIARALGIGLVAEGDAHPRQQLPGSQAGQAPPAHPLGDQGAFVLGHGAADLEQQPVLGVLA